MFQLKIFFIGIVTGLGAGVLEFLISIIYPGFNLNNQSLSFSLIIAAGLEESLKFSVARKIFETIRFKTNAFLNLMLIGVGFSATEFIFNVFWHPFNLGSLYTSYVGLFLIHGATMAIFGFYFIKIDRSVLFGLAVLTLAIVLHFLFNFSVIIEFGRWATYLILLALIAVLAQIAARRYST